MGKGSHPTSVFQNDSGCPRRKKSVSFQDKDSYIDDNYDNYLSTPELSGRG
jgi:hypothetical protein